MLKLYGIYWEKNGYEAVSVSQGQLSTTVQEYHLMLCQFQICAVLGSTP